MKLITELIDEYLEHLKSLNFRPGTISVRGYALKAFAVWLEETAGVRTPDRLRRRHPRAWQVSLSKRLNPEGLPIKPRTVNKNIEGIQMFLEYLAEEGMIAGALTHVLKYVRTPEPLPRVLPHEKIRAMLDSIDMSTPAGHRNRTMLETLYSSGTRAAELLGLDVGDVSLSEHVALVCGKGQKERIVPVGVTAIRFLESYLRGVRPGLVKNPEEKAMFLDREGNRMPYYTLRRIIVDIAEKAGLGGEVTAHVFRRSCASELVKGNASIYHVSRMLGHESLDTLKHYVKLHIADLKETHHRTHPRERDEEEREK
ncbi:MAG: tyrosine-type recombinase/integrase [Lentisphaeria bacterium]|nr:tyrosine-type recombinase/integrase [Lentisphaeria bacterium]